MKQFLVFRFTQHANGGWGDFVGYSETQDGAREVLARDSPNIIEASAQGEDSEFHIIDTGGLFPRIVIEGRIEVQQTGPLSTRIQFIEERTDGSFPLH